MLFRRRGGSVLSKGGPKASEVDAGGKATGAIAFRLPGASRRRLEGSIDLLDDHRLGGWARDRSAPHRRVVVEVVCADRRERVIADRERPDLRSAGKGDGLHGFTLTLNLRGSHPIHVRDATTGEALPGSPLLFDPIAILGSGGHRGAVELLRAEVEHARMALGDSPRADAEVAHRPGYATRSRLETLLESQEPGFDPEGLTNRYLAHRAALAGAPIVSGDLAESLSALHLYLEREAAMPGGPPLSRRQIGYLNALMPRFGSPPELTVAAYNAIASVQPNFRGSLDPAALGDAVFWWCAERAPALAPDGSLITERQIHLMTRGAFPASSYTLNDFVRRVVAQDSALAPVAGEGMLQRAVALCVLILRCARRPFLARFLPPSALADLLAPAGSSGGTRFDALLAQAVGCEPEEMHRLYGLIVERLAAHGLALANPGIAPRTIGTAPARARDPRIAPGLEPGIAVIGPAEITSGLGQATRQSIAALTAVGRNPAVLDYRRPFPSRVRDTDSDLPPILRTPRRINLIHLNADLLPMARAEIDDRVFAHSYNIGYFFWELDQVPQAHRLAFDLVDEVWVASEYNRAIFARSCDVPVHNVGLAVESLPASIPGTRRDYGLPEDGFVFLATFDAFSYVERKNPLGLVQAFRQAFPPGQAPNVHLAVKTQNKAGVFDPNAIRLWQQIDALVKDDPRIRVIDETMSYIDLLGLKKACDAYVSLHRSEGLGIGMIEAMQLGRPVIATNYSGNLEFCNEQTSFLVDATLVSVAPGQYVGVEPGSRWAEPSLSSAATQMRRVYEDAAEVQVRVAAASRLATETFSLTAIGRRYEARLAAIESQLETAISR